MNGPVNHRPIILDNTELDDAARLFAWPHCGLCFGPVRAEDEANDEDCPHCGEQLDASYAECRAAAAARLQRVAALACTSDVLGPNGMPVVYVPVQAAIDVACCRVCGCTELAACPGGCAWTEPDLCSRCAERCRG